MDDFFMDPKGKKFCDWCCQYVEEEQFDNPLSSDGVCDCCYEGTLTAMDDYFTGRIKAMTKSQRELGAAILEYYKAAV